MKITKHIFTILSAILGGLAVPGAHVQGAHRGIHTYQAHEQQQTAHRRLEAQAAGSVPQISDSALINLWAHDPSARILRNPAIELQLYEAVVAERSQNPEYFDHVHPGLGHLIRDPTYLQDVLEAEIAHPWFFAHHYYRLLPFLLGYERYISLPRTSSSPPGIPGSGTTPANPIPGGSGAGSGAGLPPSAPPPVVLPEPPGIVLLVLGMSCVAVRLGFRRSRVTGGSSTGAQAIA